MKKSNDINQLKGVPLQIVNKMLERQEEQVGFKDMSVFMKRITSGKSENGFNWCETEEGSNFWIQVIAHRNYIYFFKKYPKAINPIYEKEIINNELVNLKKNL